MILVIIGFVWVKRRRGRIFPGRIYKTQRVFNLVYDDELEPLADLKQIRPILSNEENKLSKSEIENDVWEEIELNV